MASKMPDSYIPPNVDPKCTWSLDKKPSDSPHHHVSSKLVNMIPCSNHVALTKFNSCGRRVVCMIALKYDPALAQQRVKVKLLVQPLAKLDKTAEVRK